jgi:hypothetical protein
MRAAVIVLIFAGLALSSCATEPAAYTLVQPGTAAVSKDSMTVHPSAAWNKARTVPYAIAQEEEWTRNGLVLDGVYFIGGLADGEAIVKQHPNDDRKVPVFHATMTPPDLASMVESAYRIRTGAKIFETTSLKPASFLGQHGLELDYDYMRGDDVRRRGRSMIAIAGGKLYLMTLNGTALHYFDAALPEFEEMAASASIR